MPLEPIHHTRYRPEHLRPPPPDPVAVAVKAARIGAVLAALVAMLILSFREALAAALPFDPQVLVLVAFLAPSLVAWVRARRERAESEADDRAATAGRPVRRFPPDDPQA
ncbi:MAG: hypothetical protein ACK53C_12190 [Pseudomonadota bacterium]